ncbi:Ig-like domain-containing protein [Microbacterium sulfonylureivorans]|uniref:Ig-like domain-containing protein n=1 Tax=Microbacterium sulfonylureivorans TaxID=2486854 RepID=UPI000FD71988|nr:Ig-like domain-containing protein [Microbacterium sulfonylureivorans]
MLAAVALVFGVVPATAASAAGPAVVSVVTTITDAAGNPVSTVDAQTMTHYYVNVAYSCNVADCTGTKVDLPAVAVDPFYGTQRRETATYIFNPPYTPAPAVTGTPATGLSVNLGTVAAGTSGSFSIGYNIFSNPANAPAPGSYFLNGSPVTASATISAANSDNPATSTTNATWKSTVPNPSAALNGNSTTVAAGADVQVWPHYSFSGCGTWDYTIANYRGSPWLTCAQSYDATIQLPPNAVYVSSTGGVYNPLTHTVTFAETGVNAAGGVWNDPRTVVVRFPTTAYPTTAPGCLATETFTLSHTVTYLDGQVKTANASRNVQVGNCEPFAKANITKSYSTGATQNIPVAPAAPTTSGYWGVTVNNQSNVTGVGTIVDNTLNPPGLPTRAIQVNAGGPATIDYTLDNGTTGTVVVNNGTWYAAPAGRTITAATATSSPLLPVNTSPSGTANSPFTLLFWTTLSSGTSPGVRTNTATGSMAYPTTPTLTTTSLGPANGSVNLVDPVVTPPPVTFTSGAPAATVTGGGTAVVGSEVTWRTTGSMTNVPAGSTIRPQYSFIAPLGWEILPNGASFATAAPAGTTFDYRTVTYNGTQRQAVVATWPTAVTGTITLPQLVVRSTPTLAAPAGVNTQTATALLGDAENSIVNTYTTNRYNDATDLDGDGATADAFARAEANTSLAATRGFAVTKEICRPETSAADGCDWISDPDIKVGVPPAATSIKYRITVKNTGNADLTGVNLYDVLPFIGDTGTSTATAGVPRGSTVKETLASVSNIDAGVTLAYSASTNPPRPEVYSGATTGDWTASLVGASALRATIASLPFAGSKSFVYEASLVGGSADQVACNSVAGAANLLAAIEPRAVCATTEESDLRIVAASRFPLQIGRVGAVPFTVTNLGGSATAPATAAFAVPSGVDIVDVGNAGWDCDAADTTGPTVVTCRPVAGDGVTARTLALDAPETLTFDLRPTASAASTTCVTGDIAGIYNDPNAANDTAVSCSTVTAASPEIDVTKTDGVDTVEVGAETTYTLTATNGLTGEALNGVLVTDTLPAGLEFVSASPGITVSGQEITWNVGSLTAAGTVGDGTATTGAAGSSAQATVTVRVLPGTKDTVVNTATVEASDPADGSVTLSDTASDTDSVVNVFTALDPAETTPQNTAVTTALADIVTAAGAPLDPASATAQTAPQHGAITIDPATGAVTYTPDAGYAGPDAYEIRVCDTSAPVQCTVAGATVTVEQNTVTAVDDDATTSVGAAVTTDVRANDTSASGQSLAFPTVTVAGANGTATVQGDGTVTYAPDAGFSGADAYTYEVCDTSSPTPVCDTATVDVLMHNVFVDGPAADANGGIGTAQNTPVTTPLADIVTTTGAALDATTVAEVDAPRHGSISIDPVTGAVTYTPQTGYGGTDTYEVSVCDTAAPQECHSVIVGITVPPNVVTAVDDDAQTLTGQAVTTDVRANDESESAQPFAPPTIITAPDHGAAVVNGDGTVTYTPAPGYSGTDSYRYELCDTSFPVASCDSATVTVTMGNVFVDGPAAAANAGVDTAQNTAVTTPLDDIVTTLGAPVDPTEVTQVTAPQHGSISIAASGAVTYTPTAGYSGPDAYTVHVCDTATPSQCHDVTVGVTVAANVVTAVDDPAATTADQPVTTPVLANDTSASGQPLAIPTVTAQPAGGTVTVNGAGALVYTPDDAFSGADSYAYEICDTSAPTPVCDTATVTVDVANVFVDGPAAAANDGIGTTQNVAVTTPLADILTADGSPVDATTVTEATSPQHGSIAVDPATGAVTYTPTPGYSGADAYTVTACDGATPQECHDVTVAVEVADNVVTAVDDVATTEAGQDVVTDVRGNDTSASGQAFAIPTVTNESSSGATAVNADGTITFTPAAAWSGATSYTYEVCDTSTPDPVCDTAEVAVTVDNVFAEGTAAASRDGITVAHNGAITAVLADIVTASGASLDPTTMAQESAPSHGDLTIDPVTGDVTYTPTAGYAGPDSFAVEVCDTATPQQCRSVTVAAQVEPNTVSAENDAAATDAGQSVASDVRANDTSASGQSFALPSVTAQAANGVAAVNGDGTITYTPNASFSGTDEYTYEVCDTSHPDPVCDTATVSLEIANVFIHGPAAEENIGVEVAQNSSVTTPLADIVTAAGMPLDPATTTEVTAPEHGSITIGATAGRLGFAAPAAGGGAVTYTPAPGYSGPDSYEVTVCDTATPQECDTVVIAVRVLPNTVAAPDHAIATRVDETAEPLDVHAGASSASGQPFAAPPAVTAEPEHGTVVVNADDTITYTPDAGYDGADAFTYELCDTSSPTPVCDTGVVNVTVEPVADLAVTKTLDVLAVVASKPISYLIATTNNGPSVATDVRTVDPIPAGILNPVGAPDDAVPGADCETRPTLASDLEGLAPEYGPYSLASHPNVVECTYPELPVGVTIYDTIVGTVDPALAAGADVVNQAVALSAAYDPVLADNLAAAEGDVVVLPPVISDLATTGGELRAWVLVAGLAALIAGAGCLIVAVVRSRRRSTI